MVWLCIQTRRGAVHIRTDKRLLCPREREHGDGLEHARWLRTYSHHKRADQAALTMRRRLQGVRARRGRAGGVCVYWCIVGNVVSEGSLADLHHSGSSYDWIIGNVIIMEEWISVIRDGVNAFFIAVHEEDYSSLRQCHRLLESYVIYSGWEMCSSNSNP